ncbi:MAG: hypothetical protein WBL67_15530 [Nitrososphaeraceae archaeon]
MAKTAKQYDVSNEIQAKLDYLSRHGVMASWCQADCEACFQPLVDQELVGGFLDVIASLDQNFANVNTIECVWCC